MALLGIVLPTVMCLVVEFFLIDLQPEKPEEILVVSDVTPETTVNGRLSEGHFVQVLLEDGSVQSMDLEEYITGVVLAEMPAGFEIEALKAQAVVARTYALKRHALGNKHLMGAVCIDHNCCQAYCDVDNYFGDSIHLEKIRRAVADTKDEVLTYEGQLIEATYFSCSGGRTEDAQEVWGSQVPYLQAVDSPGEESAKNYIQTVTFSRQEFSEKLGLQTDTIVIGDITYTEGEGIKTIEISGVLYEGTKLRTLLGLRSTMFIITAINDTVTVTTKGYGHRVGMSQYGAEAMAVQGADYTQILSHYYPGTTLEHFLDN